MIDCDFLLLVLGMRHRMNDNELCRRPEHPPHQCPASEVGGAIVALRTHEPLKGASETISLLNQYLQLWSSPLIQIL